MPESQTIKRAQKAKRAGKAPSTQAGEFVREEIEHVRKGKHGARSAKQAIAIGLSKARRAGVKLPKKGASSTGSGSTTSPRSRRSSASPSAKRSRASITALKREGRRAASRTALSRQARRSAATRKKAA